MTEGIKYELVELVVPANSTLTVFTFDPQPHLQNEKIVSLEVYTVNDLTSSPQGNGLPTTANFQSAYLNLYGADPDSPLNANPVNSNPPPPMGNWMKPIPLWSLHRLNNGTDPYVFELFEIEPRNIIWNKSIIQTGAVLGNSAPVSWLVLVGYTGLSNQ